MDLLPGWLWRRFTQVSHAVSEIGDILDGMCLLWLSTRLFLVKILRKAFEIEFISEVFVCHEVLWAFIAKINWFTMRWTRLKWATFREYFFVLHPLVVVTVLALQGWWCPQLLIRLNLRMWWCFPWGFHWFYVPSVPEILMRKFLWWDCLIQWNNSALITLVIVKRFACMFTLVHSSPIHLLEDDWL